MATTSFFIKGKICLVHITKSGYTDEQGNELKLYHLKEVGGKKVHTTQMLGKSFEWCANNFIFSSYCHESWSHKNYERRKANVRKAFGINSKHYQRVISLVYASNISVSSHSVGGGEWSLEIEDQDGVFLFELVGSNGTQFEGSDLYGELKQLQETAYRYKRLYKIA